MSLSDMYTYILFCTPSSILELCLSTIRSISISTKLSSVFRTVHLFLSHSPNQELVYT